MFWYVWTHIHTHTHTHSHGHKRAVRRASSRLCLFKEISCSIILVGWKVRHSSLIDFFGVSWQDTLSEIIIHELFRDLVQDSFRQQVESCVVTEPDKLGNVPATFRLRVVFIKEGHLRKVAFADANDDNRQWTLTCFDQFPLGSLDLSIFSYIPGCQDE